MEQRAIRFSILLRFYQRYLNDADTARFIVSIAQHYTIGTLQRLICTGDMYSRRASALAIGLLGDSTAIQVLGPLLNSSDRKLRLVVDDAIRAISSRDGTAAERQLLDSVVRCNECGNFSKSIELATQLIDGGGDLAEAYHQRSLALFQMGSVQAALSDCRQTLKLNEFHYAAMVGLGHCYLELGDLIEALHWFRRSLEVYPDLEPVRLQVRKLEKAIQEL